MITFSELSARWMGLIAAGILCTSSAHAQLVNVAVWAASPEARAQALQRTLSAGMPLDQNFMLVTHNGFNASNYGAGYSARGPQHTYTITEQLTLGIRGIDMDPHKLGNGQWYLSHALCDGTNGGTNQRTVTQGMTEILNWLNQPGNGDEVVFVFLEPWARSNAEKVELRNVFRNVPGLMDKVLRLTEGGFSDSSFSRFGKISPQSVRAAGRNIVIVNIGGAADCAIPFAQNDGNGDRLQTLVTGGVLNDNLGSVYSFNVAEKWMFAVGDEVEIRGQTMQVSDVNIPLRPQSIQCFTTFPYVNDWSINAPTTISNLDRINPDVCDFVFENHNGYFSSNGERVWNYIHARDFAGDPKNSNDADSNGTRDEDEIASGSAADTDGNGVPDRIQMGYWDVDCIGSRHSRDSRLKNLLAVTYGNSSISEYDNYGQITPQIMRDSARAGIDQVRIDPLGVSWAAGFQIDSDVPGMLYASIWSWDPAYLPSLATPRPAQAAIAALGGDSGRLRAASTSSVYRFAEQDEKGDWFITATKGTFGQYVPSVPGRTFRAPGNGFEMQNLVGAMLRAGATTVWVNHHDSNADGAWEASVLPRRFYNPLDLDTNNNPRPDTKAVRAPFPVIVGNRQSLLFGASFLAPLANTSFGSALLLNPGNYSGAYRINTRTIIAPAAANTTAALGR